MRHKSIKTSAKIRKFHILAEVLFGVFRRGNKPSVLPREEKRAELQKKKASFMRAERLKNKKNLVYNSSGLATALLKYRRFFK